MTRQGPGWQRNSACGTGSEESRVGHRRGLHRVVVSELLEISREGFHFPSPSEGFAQGGHLFVDA
jgi:hypothetical protein